MFRIITLVFSLLCSGLVAAQTYHETANDAYNYIRYTLCGDAWISGTNYSAQSMYYTYKGQNNQGNEVCQSSNPEGSLSFTAAYYGLGCPDGGEYDANGNCPNPDACEFGDISEDCRVFCPAKDYTYYQNGILKKGELGAGYVGHGMNCPDPSFPPGSEGACVSDDSSCSNAAPGAWDEWESVEEKTEESTSDGQGNSSSSSSSSSSGSNDSSGSGSGESSSGTSGKADDGTDIDPYAFDDPSNGYSEEMIDIGGTQYQLCEHGGIVSGQSGCDYTPPNCSANQVATAYGCVDIPGRSEPPDEAVDPGSTSTTTTTDNGDGTFTTVTTTYTSSGTPDPNETTEEEGNSSSGGDDCDEPPVCDGDPVACNTLIQVWRNRCNVDYDVSAGSCDQDFSCEGDPISCAALKQSFLANCAVQSTVSQSDLGIDQQSMIDSVSETVDVSELVDVDGIFADNGANASCPDSSSIGLSSGDYSFDYTPFCDVMSGLRPMVLFIFSFIGLRILREGI